MLALELHAVKMRVQQKEEQSRAEGERYCSVSRESVASVKTRVEKSRVGEVRGIAVYLEIVELQ